MESRFNLGAIFYELASVFDVGIPATDPFLLM